jgi:hypothetical protein
MHIEYKFDWLSEAINLENKFRSIVSLRQHNSAQIKQFSM